MPNTPTGEVTPDSCVVLESPDGTRSLLGPSKLDGNAVVQATKSFQSGNGWGANLTLTEPGAQALDALASQQFHKQIGIVVDGKLSAVPTVQPQNASFTSFDGTIRITVGDSQAAVDALIAALDSFRKASGSIRHAESSTTTAASTPSTASVSGVSGGPPPCAGDNVGSQPADAQHPDGAPLQGTRDFGNGVRWAVCGASVALSGNVLNLRSTDDGATWTVTSTPMEFSPHHSGDRINLSFDSPTNARLAYTSVVGPAADATFTTDDGGATWTRSSS
jgi:hypothetical protein